MKTKLNKKEQKQVDAEVQKLVVGWQIPILRLSEISHAAYIAHENGLPIAPAVIEALKFVGANRVA